MKTQNLFTTSITAIAIMLLSVSSLFGQDVIIKKNKEEIRCKVIEVGQYEIKYKTDDKPDSPVLVIRRDETAKIKYANGTETIITADKYSAAPEREILDKTHAIKIELFSPLEGDICIGYEHMLKVGTNLEAKLSIIGPGFEISDIKSSGMFVKLGAKFLIGQEIVVDGMRYVHPLKGKYIKPEIIFSSFTRFDVPYSDANYNSYTVDVNNNSFALMINFGKQWILGNVLTIDWYGGVGYATTSNKPKNTPSGNDEGVFWTPYYYSHWSLGNNFPLAFTWGLTMGVIF